MIGIIVFFCCVNSSIGQQNANLTWPRTIPVRVQDSTNKDLMFMTLGDVNTPVAQGVFDPSKDQVKLDDGTVIDNYYKEKLGITYFEPIDKSVFKLPPSGWCSWYYYYQDVNSDEIKRNARWIADNLKDYGAEFVQVDDGWQGVGHGNGSNRDWNTINQRFSGGMDELASFIKSLGLKPGIWLAPHGQSDEEFVKNHPDIFLLKPDGTSASDTWEGEFLVDPSARAGQNYLENLFSKMSDWGYEYYKIDGQPIVTREYRDNKEFMENPSDDTDALYRETLRSIRKGIGHYSYLLGCWIVPLEGIGIMNGSRTSADVLLDWRGFMTSLRATMQYYFLHNIAWYSDPDVMLLRSPLPLKQARAWASLQGLTGESLMNSDRVTDLSQERVNILRKVYPAVNIRPLDLFPHKMNKRIWDLKIHHLDRDYDVVGLFNFRRDDKNSLSVSWNELGISDDSSVHVFDFWNNEYLGEWENGISLSLDPTSCKVLSLVPDNGQIQLVSTNRHITQGWVDLIDVDYNNRQKVFKGESKVIKRDPYELRFAFPQGKNYRINNVKVSTPDHSKDIPVKILNHDGWAEVQLTPFNTGKVQWEVSFKEATLSHRDTEAPDNLWIELDGVDEANLQWTPRLQTVAGYRVYLNGKNMGYTPQCVFHLKNLSKDSTYKAKVQTVWWDGTGSDKKASLEFKFDDLLSDTVHLSDLQPVGTGSVWRNPRFNKTVSGHVLNLDGKQHYHGLGIPTNSQLKYDLKGRFNYFSALVGMDENNSNSRNDVFIIVADGEELWRSDPLTKKQKAQKIELNIEGVQELTLKVRRGDHGGTGDNADWVNAIVAK